MICPTHQSLYEAIRDCTYARWVGMYIDKVVVFYIYHRDFITGRLNIYEDTIIICRCHYDFVPYIVPHNERRPIFLGKNEMAMITSQQYCWVKEHLFHNKGSWV